MGGQHDKKKLQETPLNLDDTTETLMVDGILSDDAHAPRSGHDQEATLFYDDSLTSTEDILFPVKNWERYKLKKLIGVGGMGKVFLAFDPRLERQVAIKFLNGRDPEQVARFIQGARAQARVDHPNICRIYEVGEVEGQPFIAMHYIPGRSLSAIAEDMTLEQKLVVLRKVAFAVQEAHRAGLIHRDIKPGNIMVEKDEDGDHVPYVLDFGLARMTGDSGLTTEGSMLGTPSYMPPEQASGGELDRRADVYALGATLYKILADEPPFTGASVGMILMYIQTREAPKLRASRPEIPRDVQTIVEKCLEKRPDDRYPSARALADDLGRYLDGEPIEAKPAGLWERLVKKARKNRLAFGLGAAAIFLLTMSMGWGIHTAWRASIRESIARELTEQVKEIETFARNAYLSPAHDLTDDLATLDGLMTAMEKDIEESGNVGRDQGSYALGMGSLVTSDLEEARTHLTAAWDDGFREPRVAYGLGLVYSALYRQQLEDLGLIEDAETRERERGELDRTYGGPARAFISRAEGYSGGDPAYLKALLAFCAREFEEALTQLDKVDQDRAWFYEHHLLRGEIYRELARKFDYQGDRDEGRDMFRRALEASARAVDIGRGDPGVRRSMAKLLFGMMSFDLFAEDDLSGYQEQALEHLEAAVLMLPRDSEARLLQARIFRRMAHHRHVMEQDPVDPLKKAEAAAIRGLKLAEDKSEAHFELGAIYWRWANWLGDQHEDPSLKGRMQARAVAELDQVAPSHRDYEYFHIVGQARRELASRPGEGVNACVEAVKAIEALRQVVALRPNRYHGYHSLGNMLRTRSEMRACDGPPAMEWITESMTTLEKAVELNPEQWVMHYNLGRVYLLAARDGNPQTGKLDPVYAEKALAQYQQGLDLDPALKHHLYNVIGSVHLAKLRYAFEKGEDITPPFEAAREAYELCLEQAPKSRRFIQNLAWLYFYRGKFRVRSGEDPGQDLDQALELSRKADYGLDSRLCIASALRMEAERALDMGRNVEQAIGKAEQAFEDLLGETALGGEVHRSLGRIYTMKAKATMMAGRSPISSFSLAEKHLAKAVKGEEDSPYIFLAFARLHLLQAVWEKEGSGIERGKLATSRILTIRPEMPEAAALKACFQKLEATKETGGENASQAEARLQGVMLHNNHLRHEFSHRLNQLIDFRRGRDI